MTQPTEQRIEERAREILANAKGRLGAAMAPRQAKLLAESQLRHEDALSAAYARGLRDAREIVGDLPLNNGDGIIINDMKIERDCEAIRAIDARLSALKDGGE